MRIQRGILKPFLGLEARWVEYRERLLGRFVKHPPAPEHVNDVETAVGQVLVPVRTPPDFRRYLGQNLALAAWRKGVGLEVERLRPPRFWFAVAGISAAILAAMTTLLIALRIRSNSARE